MALLSRLVDPLLRVWTAESSPVALRTKQAIASVVPERVLLGLKKRYYLELLRNDSDDRMELDAQALPRFVKPGDFVIDVGAFVGFYSQRLSKLVGPTGAVWSFEPMPQTFQILESSVRSLGLTNVRLLPYAVSDRERSAAMEIPRYRGGGESFWDAKIVEEGSSQSFRRFTIATKTLDSLLVGTDRPVKFIKIDAEYHELQAMRGAVESFRRWHPIIQVETLEPSDEPGTDFHAMLELLGGLGYSPYRFDGKTFHLRQRGEREQNLFFLTDQHARTV
jgi:FkbM family methyltransferase